MKFTEQNLKQLNQLDRIEFRQKYERIEKKYNNSFSIYAVWLVIGIGVMFNLISLNVIAIGFLGGQEFLINLLNWFVKLSIFGLLLGALLDIFQGCLFIRERKKLIKEYFKLDLKKK